MTRLLLVSALLLPLAAHAQTTRQPTDAQKQAMQERWNAADANSDGYIDKAEAEAKMPRVARNFDKLDADQDGKLSSEEFKAAAGKLGQRRQK
ncbi:EF-hand domain-containing protein [Pseudoxanthomonas kalamensis]|uniref:EF-hand domain-containing protein n=1 Tax=Pseudoxanthomonas kalamensis TaxID=289483 RepID=UPI001B879744|nr:EF-hand domain-containing protein [Pseudoxanthomonas kalamensis]